MLRRHEERTPYELWFGRKATVKHFRVFGSKCYIKRLEQNSGKFEARADEGIFLGYSSHSKAYRCYNKRTRKIVDCVDVRIDEKPEPIHAVHEQSPVYEDLDESDNEKTESDDHSENEDLSSHKEGKSDDGTNEKKENTRWHNYHGINETDIIGDPQIGAQTRRTKTNLFSLLSTVEPKTVAEASKDDSWVKPMHE